VIAGNIGTGEAAQALIDAGADAVKVGIGPGSICTTRVVAGVGVPQITAIMNVVEVASRTHTPVIADGGIKQTGDVPKAIAAGADTIMVGGMLAGHDQGGGTVKEQYELNGAYDPITKQPMLNVTQYMQFYGMSSDTAMTKNDKEMANYRSSEGRTVLVPYRGDVDKTVQNILGGLRSACTYVGARTLKELPRGTTFIRVQKQFNDVFAKR
jgi:GMP reductase